MTEELQSALAAGAAVERSMLLHTQQQGAARGVLATLLYTQLEHLIRGVFYHWRAVISLSEEGEVSVPASVNAAPDTEKVPVLVAELQGAEARKRLQVEAVAEAAEVKRLQHRLETVAAQNAVAQASLLHREQAAHGVLSGLLARQLVTAIRGAFCAWRNVHVDRKRERLQCTFEAWHALCSVRREVLLAQAGMAKPALQQPTNGNAINGSTTSGHAIDMLPLCFAHREAATRNVLATLLAGQLELCVRGAFDLWRVVVHQRGSTDVAEPVRNEGVVLQLKAALAEALADRDAAREAARKAELTAREREEATTEAGLASQLKVAATTSLLRQQEQATRQIFTSLLASQMELVISGAFSIWREVVKVKGFAARDSSSPTGDSKEKVSQQTPALAVSDLDSRQPSAEWFSAAQDPDFDSGPEF